ncbi:MAG: pentapeptide repeat-containing protein [Deltaproteobacteria bacterium]|nr:pentapeptide repeat-containing protein [Deltaproteobacteria bacterium]
MAGDDVKKTVDTYQELEVAVGSGEVRDSLVRRQDLSNLKMAGAAFHGTDLVEVGLAGSMMKDCRLERCALTGAAMRGADLGGARLEDVEIRSCEAMEASFRRSNLLGVTFSETSLGNADFAESELVRVVFSASDLYSAAFTRAVIVESRFVNRRLGNAVLSRADFTGAVIMDGDFRAADLAGACFRDALLVGTCFKDANITDVDFEGALLVSADFTRVTADPGTRAALMKAMVRPAESSEAILDYLSSRDVSLTAVVHSLLLGYVLRRLPDAVATDLSSAEDQGAAEEIAEDIDVPVSDAGDPVSSDSDGHAGATVRQTDVAEPAGPGGVARESQEVYERFKKIELD